MKRIKISLAALAFLLTAGVTYASKSSVTGEPCKTPAGGTINSSACPGGSVLCCTSLDGQRQYQQAN